jgi:hypothetical protein
VAASLAFGAGLFAVAVPMMLRSRALAHVLPDGLTAGVGFALTLAAAALGGWAAARLADRLAAR